MHTSLKVWGHYKASRIYNGVCNSRAMGRLSSSVECSGAYESLTTGILRTIQSSAADGFLAMGVLRVIQSSGAYGSLTMGVIRAVQSPCAYGSFATGSLWEIGCAGAHGCVLIRFIAQAVHTALIQDGIKLWPRLRCIQVEDILLCISHLAVFHYRTRWGIKVLYHLLCCCYAKYMP